MTGTDQYGMRHPGVDPQGMKYERLDIHVWHVQMTAHPQPTTQKKTEAPEPQYELRSSARPLPELNRFLYATVGGPWKWYMRLQWTWQQWHDYLTQPDIHTWIAYQDATPIGYFELEQRNENQGKATEIVYFGLIPEFVGQGLGRPLLEDAIKKAWELSSERIWLHTCSLDHDNALPNYLGRGFEIFKEEDFVDTVPTQLLEPWPGAAKLSSKQKASV